MNHPGRQSGYFYGAVAHVELPVQPPGMGCAAAMGYSPVPASMGIGSPKGSVSLEVSCEGSGMVMPSERFALAQGKEAELCCWLGDGWLWEQPCGAQGVSVSPLPSPCASWLPQKPSPVLGSLPFGSTAGHHHPPSPQN